jgi:ABC-type phosphate transport system permease subunit
LREASLALGSTEWRMARRILIPTAITGLITATLATGRQDSWETFQRH